MIGRMFLVLFLGALLVAAVAGCASPEYWKAGMFTPVPGKTNIIYTSEMPTGFCGHENSAGCWIPGTNFVYMLDTLMLSEEECYGHHEGEMHQRRGYGHEEGSQPYDICGYATLRKLQ